MFLIVCGGEKYEKKILISFNWYDVNKPALCNVWGRG